MIDLGVQAGILDKAGSWYSYGSQRIGQGRESTRNFLKDNPEVMTQIERSIRDNAGLVADQMIGGADVAGEAA
jgi:recombination protein RecA